MRCKGSRPRSQGFIVPFQGKGVCGCPARIGVFEELARDKEVISLDGFSSQCWHGGTTPFKANLWVSQAYQPAFSR